MNKKSLSVIFQFLILNSSDNYVIYYDILQATYFTAISKDSAVRWLQDFISKDIQQIMKCLFV